MLIDVSASVPKPTPVSHSQAASYSDVSIVWPEVTPSNHAAMVGDLADADVILTYGVRDGSSEESTQAMIDHPLFQSLKAVQAGHPYIWQLIIPSSYGEALQLIDQVESVLKTLRDEAS